MEPPGVVRVTPNNYTCIFNLNTRVAVHHTHLRTQILAVTLRDALSTLSVRVNFLYHGAIGIVLLYGPPGALFLMSEVTL